MRRILSAFFQLLYHQLAWSYDLVAWIVSFGAWDRWTTGVIAYLPAGKLLEIGFGTGRLHTVLSKSGRCVFGLDESAQMVRLAHRRITAGGLTARLTRGRAQALPFATDSFDAVTATFPAPFIFEPLTASEIHRTLKPGGQLVALLAFRPTSPGWTAALVRTIFSLTGQIPSKTLDPAPIETAFLQAGLEVQTSWKSEPTGEMLLVEAFKPLENRSYLG